MPADLLPTRFKPETWLLNKSDIVLLDGNAPSCFCVFTNSEGPFYRSLLTLLCLLLPHSAFYWVFFCLLRRERGSKLKKKIQALGGFGCEVLVKVYRLSVVWWNLIGIPRLVRQAVVMAFAPPALLSVWWYLWQAG